MRKIASVFVVVAIIFGILAAYTWATIPLNISGVTVQPTIKVMDDQGNIQTLTAARFQTITYPGANKIQLGTTLKFDLVGLTSAKIAWWLNYRINLKSQTSGKTGGYIPWAGQTLGDGEYSSWTGDSGWGAYWKDDWSITVTPGQSLDIEPCKKQWWTGNAWAYDLSDGWIPLNPATKHSFGDWIKWKWGETPAGSYEAKLSLRVKVNYIDNFGKERNAIGPPYIRPGGITTGANGELNDILTFTVTYQAGTVTVTVTPKISPGCWVPLDMAGTLSPLAVNFATFFVTMGLPTWTAHIVFPALAVTFGALAYHYRSED